MKYLKKLDRLRDRKDNWDGYKSPATKINSIYNAVKFLNNLYSIYQFEEPSISSDENGDVFINWGDGQKELDFYVEDNRLLCIQAWGENINNEMKDFYIDFSDYKTIIELLEWLNIN